MSGAPNIEGINQFTNQHYEKNYYESMAVTITL